MEATIAAEGARPQEPEQGFIKMPPGKLLLPSQEQAAPAEHVSVRHDGPFPAAELPVSTTSQALQALTHGKAGGDHYRSLQYWRRTCWSSLSPFYEAYDDDAVAAAYRLMTGCNPRSCPWRGRLYKLSDLLALGLFVEGIIAEAENENPAPEE
jgi:hypothetical protein